jgi:hypothetical protein
VKHSPTIHDWSFLLLSLFLFAAGVTLVIVEAAPFFRSAGDNEARWHSLVGSSLPAGISTTARDLVINDCLWATKSVYGRVANTAERIGVLDSCRSFLIQHVAAFPTDPYGFAVQAAVEGVLGHKGDFDLALQRSQATGPYEEWVSEVRVPLAELHLDWLSQLTAAGHLADLAVLVQTQRGVRAIAARYVNEPAFRERITEVVETLPTNAQLRFLQAVRHVVPRAPSS